MPSCVMKGCTNNSGIQKKLSGITFHKFPRNLSVRENWISAVRENRNDVNWLPSEFSVVCSAHFEEWDFYHNTAGYRLIKKNTTPKKVSTPKLQNIRQVQNETNQLPLMMLKVEPIQMNNEVPNPITNESVPITYEPTDPISIEPTDTKTNEPKNAITNKAPNPKRRRRHRPPVSNAASNLQESIMILNNTLTREKTEDDCDIYGKLLATKLRRYPEDERTRMMYQIDGLLLSQPPTRPQPSVFNEHCNRPNSVEADNNQPSSSTHQPPNNLNSMSRYEKAISTVDRSEAEESILSTETSDTGSIDIKSELEDVMEFEIGEENLI